MRRSPSFVRTSIGTDGLFLYADLLAQRADFNDEVSSAEPFLSQRRIERIDPLRIDGQRNRLRRRLAIVNRVPQLFGQERHDGRQQPQRSLKDRNQRRQCAALAFSLSARL